MSSNVLEHKRYLRELEVVQKIDIGLDDILRLGKKLGRVWSENVRNVYEDITFDRDLVNLVILREVPLKYDEKYDYTHANRLISMCILACQKLSDEYKHLIKTMDEEIEALSKTFSARELKIAKNIEDEILSFHDANLIKNREVFHIYSDGGITMQKGGCLYGNRNEHSIHSELIIPNMSLPLQGGYLTYGIVTYEDAKKIRQMMLKITRTTV